MPPDRSSAPASMEKQVKGKTLSSAIFEIKNCAPSAYGLRTRKSPKTSFTFPSEIKFQGSFLYWQYSYASI